MLYPGPVRRGTVRGRTSAPAAPHDGSGTHILPGIERGAQAGIEPATGAWVTQQIGSAKAVRNMSTPVHSSAGTSPWAQSQSRVGPGTQPRCKSGSPRHRAEGSRRPEVRGGVDPGLRVRSPRCSHGARSSDPASGDRERRPGGHRARHGRLGDYSRSAQPERDRSCPHICTRVDVALARAGSTSHGNQSLATGEGDVRIDDAGVWTLMYRSGGAEGYACRRPRRARCPPGRRFVSEADVTDAISSGVSAPHVTTSALPSGS